MSRRTRIIGPVLFACGVAGALRWAWYFARSRAANKRRRLRRRAKLSAPPMPQRAAKRPAPRVAHDPAEEPMWIGSDTLPVLSSGPATFSQAPPAYSPHDLTRWEGPSWR